MTPPVQHAMGSTEGVQRAQTRKAADAPADEKEWRLSPKTLLTWGPFQHESNQRPDLPRDIAVPGALMKLLRDFLSNLAASATFLSPHRRQWLTRKARVSWWQWKWWRWRYRELRSIGVQVYENQNVYVRSGMTTQKEEWRDSRWFE